MPERFDPTLVKKAHDRLVALLGDEEEKQAFAPAAGIGQAPPMDPSMMQGGGGAPPMDPSMMGGGGGAPPMDPAMMQGGGAPPMDPSMMQGGGGAPPMPPEGGGGEMPPIMVNAQDLMALFAQIAQEVGGGGGGQEAGALDEITKRLDNIESALGIGGEAGPLPGEAGAMPPMPPMPPEAAMEPPMPPMGEAMTPMMDATAAPMPGMPVAASGSDGQIKMGKAEKIGDLVAKLRRK